MEWLFPRSCFGLGIKASHSQLHVPNYHLTGLINRGTSEPIRSERQSGDVLQAPVVALQKSALNVPEKHLPGTVTAHQDRSIGGNTPPPFRRDDAFRCGSLLCRLKRPRWSLPTLTQQSPANRRSTGQDRPRKPVAWPASSPASVASRSQRSRRECGTGQPLSRDSYLKRLHGVLGSDEGMLDWSRRLVIVFASTGQPATLNRSRVSAGRDIR